MTTELRPEDAIELLKRFEWWQEIFDRPAPLEPDAPAPPVAYCRKCETRVYPAKPAFGLCAECYHDLCEKSDSYGYGTEGFRRLLRESYEAFPFKRGGNRASNP